MKGQAALEFLMTYGWAILVVLAAIAALAYFGVLSPDRFLPEKCTLPAGIACLDFTSDGSSITMVVANSAGFDMETVSLAVNGTGCSVVATGPTSLDNGQQGNFVATCSPPSGKFKGDLAISYVNKNTQLAHTKAGEIVAQIP